MSVRTRTYVRTVKPREQGDIGERAAAAWLLTEGAHVAIPFGHSPDWDLLAEIDRALYRVQVKTSSCFIRGRWSVTLCTRGGNQSWNGLVKRLDPQAYDFLFVLVGDGRQWFIPSRELGGSGVMLGGPKYASFEVERGRPIADGGVALARIASARRDVRVVKGGGL